MKNLLIFGSIALLSLSLTSCGCSKEVVTNEKTVVEKETIHDTVFVIKPDSVSYKAQLNCDSLGNVKITSAESSSSELLNSPSVRIVDNVIYVDCTTKAQELFHQWKEKYISNIQTSTESVEVPAGLTVWQHVQIWLGRLLIILFIVAIVALFVNSRLNKK